MRVLVISHGHPKIRKGGGEIVAYSQYKNLRKQQGVEAYFLAHADDERLFSKPGTIVGFAEHEYLFSTDFDPVYLTASTHNWLDNFANFLNRIKPDVVHFHHYYKSGLNSIKLTRSILGDDVRIVVTLHEFLAICQNDGQMLKSNGSSCLVSSVTACTICNSSRSLVNSFVRDVNVKQCFADVNLFISPSEFLRSRYIAWGLPADNIIVLENGYEGVNHNQRSGIRNADQITFGFFGQFTPYKGVDIFSDAALIVNGKVGAGANFVVYGSRQGNENDEFGQRIQQIKKRSDGVVSFMGGYSEDHVVSLMKSVDWIVIPSRWWENSPVVVDEARAAGVPMIVANHGGLAEKVVDRNFGLGFIPGSSASLAEKMLDVINSHELKLNFSKTIMPPVNVQDICSTLIKKYREFT